MEEFWRDWARERERAARELESTVSSAVAAFGEQVKAEAVAFSLGPYSLKELADMGHPYSKANPQPPDDPAIINLQTGHFLRGWTLGMVQRAPDAIWITVGNYTKEADFLDRGTNTMIRRPLVERLESLLLPRFERFMQSAVQNLAGGAIQIRRA